MPRDQPIEERPAEVGCHGEGVEKHTDDYAKGSAFQDRSEPFHGRPTHGAAERMHPVHA